MKTYAVIFFSRRVSDEQDKKYNQDADAMLEAVSKQPGYIGNNSVRDAAEYGITVSYWQSPEAILAWRNNKDHRVIQEKGRKEYYEEYIVRRAEVLRKIVHAIPHAFSLQTEICNGDALFKRYLPPTAEENYSVLIITVINIGASALCDQVTLLLVESNYSGMEYITDKTGDQSIGLIYWADKDGAQLWYDAHTDLFNKFSCTVEIGKVERTNNFSVRTPNA